MSVLGSAGLLSFKSTGGTSAGGGSLDSIINSLVSARAADVGKIESLFDSFGTGAKLDAADTFAKEAGRRKQDLISRGLSQTTRRETSLADLAERKTRTNARIDEQVAVAKASFLQSQLPSQELLANLITNAAASPTNAPGGGKTNVIVGPSGVTVPDLKKLRGDPGTPPAPSTSPRTFTNAGGQTNSGRVFTNPNAKRGGGASTTAAAPSSPAQPLSPLAPPPSSGGGSGEITDLATGQTTKIDNAGNVSTEGGAAPAGNKPSGGGQSITIVSRTPRLTGVPAGTTKVITIPAGMSADQAIREGRVPTGWGVK